MADTPGVVILERGQKGGTDVMTIVLVVAGVGTLAGGVYYFWQKTKKPPPPPSPGDVEKVSVEYRATSGVLVPGAGIIAKVTWRNIGTTAIAPQFELDIKSNYRDTVNEGDAKTSPKVDPGKTGVFEISSPSIPTDWPTRADSTVEARLMLIGGEGVWDSYMFELLPRTGIIDLSQTIVFDTASVSQGATATGHVPVGYQGPAQDLVLEVSIGEKSLTGGDFTVESGMKQQFPLHVDATLVAESYSVPFSIAVPTSAPAKTYDSLKRVLKSGAELATNIDADTVTITSATSWANVQKLLLSYSPQGSTDPAKVALNRPVNVVIQWKNVGTVPLTPYFRADIKNNSKPWPFNTVIEGVPLSGTPSLPAAPGATAFGAAITRPIPGDWDPGDSVTVRIMLIGMDGVWDEKAFTIAGSGVGAMQLLGVSYSSPRVGSPVVATVTLKNASAAAVSPVLRCDLRNDSQWFATWQEKRDAAGNIIWTAIGSVAPGQTVTVNIESKSVPSDWAGGSLSAQLVLQGLEGKWGDSLRSGLIVGSGTKYQVGDNLQLDELSTLYHVDAIVTIDGILWYVLNDGTTQFRVEVSVIDASPLWHKV